MRMGANSKIAHPSNRVVVKRTLQSERKHYGVNKVNSPTNDQHLRKNRNRIG